MKLEQVEIITPPGISEADLFRRKRESAEAERMGKRSRFLLHADRPLSEGEKEESVSIREKLDDRHSSFFFSNQLLIYEEFTEETASGIPFFDNFLSTSIFDGHEGRGLAVRTKFREQNPELWERLTETQNKATEEGRIIEPLRVSGEFQPIRYPGLNGHGHARAKHHPVIYEVYTKLHSHLSEEEKKSLGFVYPATGEVAPTNFILFDTGWM
jgi:hypothetical protein